MTFLGIQDQEVIKPYFICTKVDLKIVYDLIKCFCHKKTGYCRQHVEFLANKNIFMKMLKSKGPSYRHTNTVTELTSLFSVC